MSTTAIWAAGLAYCVGGTLGVALRGYLEPWIAGRQLNDRHCPDDGFRDPETRYSIHWPEALYGWFLFWWIMLPLYAAGRFAMSMHNRGMRARGAALERGRIVRATEEELAHAERDVDALLENR